MTTNVGIVGMGDERGAVKTGDYVLASRWSDASWNDPWAVGFVTEIQTGNGETMATFAICDKNGSPIKRHRRWNNARIITPAQGTAILEAYPRMEGKPFYESALLNLLELSKEQETTSQEKVVKIWEFDDALIEYQQLSENGGDEDWIALVIGYGDETPLIIEQISSGLFSVDRYSVSEGIVYIGAHA